MGRKTTCWIYTLSAIWLVLFALTDNAKAEEPEVRKEYVVMTQIVTPTPVPTATPMPTPTPEPIATPTPEPTPTEIPARYSLTDEEMEILCRITEAEATGGTVGQKINVASCVMNRVDSESWPNSVERVVFQKSQFSPISDGRYYTVAVTDETREAVNTVVDAGPNHDCENFCTPTCKSAKSGYHSRLQFEFCDGIHNYYR